MTVLPKITPEQRTWRQLTPRAQRALTVLAHFDPDTWKTAIALGQHMDNDALSSLMPLSDLGLVEKNALARFPLPSEWRLSPAGRRLVLAIERIERARGSMVDDVRALMAEIREWQAVQFPTRTPLSIATHLAKEANELKANPSDVEEMADIFLLLTAATEPHPEFFDVVRAKLEKNRRRTWGEPDADGVVTHIAEGDDGASP
jgi:hypothetical protein